MTVIGLAVPQEDPIGYWEPSLVRFWTFWAWSAPDTFKNTCEILHRTVCLRDINLVVTGTQVTIKAMCRDEIA